MPSHNTIQGIKSSAESGLGRIGTIFVVGAVAVGFAVGPQAMESCTKLLVHGRPGPEVVPGLEVGIPAPQTLPQK